MNSIFFTDQNELKRVDNEIGEKLEQSHTESIPTSNFYTQTFGAAQFKKMKNDASKNDENELKFMDLNSNNLGHYLESSSEMSNSKEFEKRNKVELGGSELSLKSIKSGSVFFRSLQVNRKKTDELSLNKRVLSYETISMKKSKVSSVSWNGLAYDYSEKNKKTFEFSEDNSAKDYKKMTVARDSLLEFEERRNMEVDKFENSLERKMSLNVVKDVPLKPTRKSLTLFPLLESKTNERRYCFVDRSINL